MKLLPVSSTVYDFFRPLSFEEKMDSVQNTIHSKSEDQNNGWGRWTRVAFKPKTRTFEILKGSPLTTKDYLWLNANANKVR